MNVMTYVTNGSQLCLSSNTCPHWLMLNRYCGWQVSLMYPTPVVTHRNHLEELLESRMNSKTAKNNFSDSEKHVESTPDLAWPILHTVAALLRLEFFCCLRLFCCSFKITSKSDCSTTSANPYVRKASIPLFMTYEIRESAILLSGSLWAFLIVGPRRMRGYRSIATRMTASNIVGHILGAETLNVSRGLFPALRLVVRVL